MHKQKLFQKETEKALENFPISHIPFSFSLAQTISAIKISTAQAHKALGTLDKTIADAIIEAGQEILDGQWKEQFVVDQIQGGAGTSIHMNVNEVIATRATLLLKNKIVVHPIDHVNLAQSTNDVIPSAMKIHTLQMLDTLIKTYEELIRGFEKKTKEFQSILKVGRTHLQDAVPITLGQEFEAHAFMAQRDTQRLLHAKKCLYEINLGGSAIGTGLTGSKAYTTSATEFLKKITGYPLISSSNLISCTQYPDAFLEVSSTLTVLCANLIKCMNDLRLLCSGPRAGFNEIQFEERQKGSSIMPGKVNPIMPETMNQICFQVIGNNQTILMATQAGQLELNVMLPIVGKNLSESLTLLTNGLQAFIKYGLSSLKANTQQCEQTFENSLCMATALSPHIGYDATAQFVKKSLSENKTLKEIIKQEKILNEFEYKKIFDVNTLTEME